MLFAISLKSILINGEEQQIIGDEHQTHTKMEKHSHCLSSETGN